MKSCDVREANTICAAAARMRGGGLSGSPPPADAATSGIAVCVDGACTGGIEGAVGAWCSGGASAPPVFAPMSCQHAARCRMWNVSICAQAGGRGRESGP